MANCPRSQGGGHFTTLFSRNAPLSLPHFHLLSLHAVILPASSPLAQTAGNSSKFKDPAGTWSPSAPPSRQGCASARSVSACAHFLISLVLVAAEQLQSMLSSYGRHSLPPAFQPDRNSFQVCLYIFGSDRSPRSANVSMYVCMFASSLSRAVNLHHSGSNLQAISQE